MAVTIVPIRNAGKSPHPSLTVTMEVEAGRGRTANDDRVEARGKFLWAGKEKLYVKGITYGTFRPNKEGVAFPALQRVEQDFSMMSASGINALRTYTVPPRWLLDSAHQHGLRVLVGFQTERHYAFLHSRRLVREIRKQVKDAARVCAKHPAVLGYALGKEIPATIVRWHGARKVENFLKELHEEVKE
ncbi:MAG TPA: glycosyl transferase, partial [Candidatus Dormibacteraeota bacterium]|nr:glycosyl transferase [Candidatus Dormibacteraeota bacterium]